MASPIHNNTLQSSVGSRMDEITMLLNFDIFIFHFSFSFKKGDGIVRIKICPARELTISSTLLRYES